MSAFRDRVIQARQVWMEENPAPEGVDLVTPFDRFLYSDTPAPNGIEDLQREVFEFARETFGEGREDAAWKKLFEELGEVLKDPRNPGEWGDVFILLLDLATVYGVEVGTATRDKLVKIRDRVWDKTETGTFQHVPGQTKDAAPRTIQHRAAFNGGGPWRSVEAVTCPEGEEPPEVLRPVDADGPHYRLDFTQRALDGQTTYFYRWVNDGH